MQRSMSYFQSTCGLWDLLHCIQPLHGCWQLLWKGLHPLLLLLLLPCLHRNQRKKAALAFTKDAYSKLQAENQALLQQLEESNRESYQVSEQFRQELLGKNQKIAELQLQLDQVRTHGTAFRACVLTCQAVECTVTLHAAARRKQGVAYESGVRPSAATWRSSHACQHTTLLPPPNTGSGPKQ